VVGADERIGVVVGEVVDRVDDQQRLSGDALRKSSTWVTIAPSCVDSSADGHSHRRGRKTPFAKTFAYPGEGLDLSSVEPRKGTKDVRSQRLIEAPEQSRTRV
jgi:hypothetical protein